MGDSPEPGRRRPAALLPPTTARLGGFAALALLGALEWERMVAGHSAARAALWVLVAVGAGLAVLWADGEFRSRGAAGPPRHRAKKTTAVAVLGLLAGYGASGLPLALLKPRRWDELGEGLARGVEALGSVQLPYAATDPWPGRTLQLVGAMLCVCAALLAFWPREGSRGFPFFALATLLVLVASPVVSLGAPAQLLLGIVLAVLTVAFLWLERLPLKPGAGVAALIALAVVGALPLASAADKEDPWFDYKAFAEGLGPGDPVRFDWGHSYGPIYWPREGSEVLRVGVREPSYWAVRRLAGFDGRSWREVGLSGLGQDPTFDLVSDWEERPSWNQTLRVTVRRMQGTDLIGAGTTFDVRDSSREVTPSGLGGAWRAEEPLRPGDSYTVLGHVPRPRGDQLARSTAGAGGARSDHLALTIPFRADAAPIPNLPYQVGGSQVRWSRVLFPPFAPRGEGIEPVAEYPTVSRSGPGLQALRRSSYLRTWRLARRLARRSDTAYDYVVEVNRYLQDGFAYDERPAAVPVGEAALDWFLHDSKRGYCQHFSGAMAILLRMGGVPARVVTGFSPGGYSERKQAWVVRDTDAHSWVEAWFDDYGWVTFDPTPAGTPARSQIAALERPSTSSDSGSTSDNSSGGGGVGDLPRRGAEGGPGVSSTETETSGDSGLAWWWLVVPVVLLAALAVWFATRLRWRRRAPREQLERAVAELEAALRRSGRPAPAATTLRQLEQRLGRTPEAAAYLEALRAGRYAPEAPIPTAAGRRALRRELPTGRGPAGRVRALWALPPWRIWCDSGLERSEPP